MRQPTIGLLHPGAMGAAVGRVLRARGLTVLWSSHGRSGQSRARAGAAGLTDAGSAAELFAASDIVLSICPPHAALQVAMLAAGFDGIYVDANAVAPATARRIAREVGSAAMVDGGILGPPPDGHRDTRLYLSGDRAAEVGALFRETAVDARVVEGGPGAASAVKMAYAAWTKGSAALLLTARELAAREGVEEILVTDWEQFSPEVLDRWRRAANSATAKGWRWVGEMDEIAASMAAQDLPDGFHLAAAEVYRERGLG
ncbi:MAG: DUF1932 domain-containing protein [Nitriliruptorales bacterium]|nr:DUF1932 domain-containing protein [Nitriliruptorales bacterium]